MIYLDNAATTMHKPADGDRCRDAGDVARSAMPDVAPRRVRSMLPAPFTAAVPKLARLLGCPQADHVCFTSNSTAALNTAINGVVRPGDRVVTTVLEHNSVLRPLNRLAAEQGVTVEHTAATRTARSTTTSSSGWSRPVRVPWW